MCFFLTFLIDIRIFFCIDLQFQSYMIRSWIRTCLFIAKRFFLSQTSLAVLDWTFSFLFKLNKRTCPFLEASEKLFTPFPKLLLDKQYRRMNRVRRNFNVSWWGNGIVTLIIIFSKQYKVYGAFSTLSLFNALNIIA